MLEPAARQPATSAPESARDGSGSASPSRTGATRPRSAPGSTRSSTRRPGPRPRGLVRTLRIAGSQGRTRLWLEARRGPDPAAAGRVLRCPSGHSRWKQRHVSEQGRRGWAAGLDRPHRRGRGQGKTTSGCCALASNSAAAPAPRSRVIPTASRLNETGGRYEQIFGGMGARNVNVLDFDTCDRARTQPHRAHRADSGIFITGGNQPSSAARRCWKPSAHQRARVPVSGTSAAPASSADCAIAGGGPDRRTPQPRERRAASRQHGNSPTAWSSTNALPPARPARAAAHRWPTTRSRHRPPDVDGDTRRLHRPGQSTVGWWAPAPVTIIDPAGLEFSSMARPMAVTRSACSASGCTSSSGATFSLHAGSFLRQVAAGKVKNRTRSRSTLRRRRPLRDGCTLSVLGRPAFQI